MSHDALREHLLAHAVRRGDFVLKSGKATSWFIDAKQTTCRPDGLVLVADALLQAIPEATTAAIGALLMVLSNLMKRMVALRIFALGANLFFIIHFVIEQNVLNAVLQATLLAINAWRLWALRRLLRSLEAANVDPPIRDWLLPQMKKRKFPAGSVLFRIGEPANELYYIESGTIHSPEVGASLGAGSMVGEIGMFSAEHVRAATVVCVTDVVAYSMTDEAAYVLYVSNPQIGFYLVRLIIKQMRAQLEIARPQAAVASVTL
jgi:multisubunit Na+/H+ antiporter MnhC subunit